MLTRFNLHRSFSTAASTTKIRRVAVIGSGPAGFYTAYKILKTTPNVQVDLLESLPIPYGLVRFGVAPDHPEVKSVQNKFDEVAKDPRFCLLGNVQVGKHMQVQDLRSRYNALVLAYGASKDRHLNVPGESLQGIHAARDFVGWYNGSPMHRNLKTHLDQSDTAVIVGQGNVALDVARILLTPVDVLRKTDITEYALEALSKSRVRRVAVLGRRGPVQVAFTAKEFREMFAIPDVRFEVDRGLVKRDLDRFDNVLQRDRSRKRLMQLLDQKADASCSEGERVQKQADKTWSLRFYLSPIEFKASPSDANHVGQVVCALNQLDEHQRVVQSGVTESIHTGLVFRSIGYQTVAVPGVPIDPKLNHVPHAQGRVMDGDTWMQGLYVAGWLKRGPSGVIAATMYDAFQTAASVSADLEAGLLDKDVPSREQVLQWFHSIQPSRPTSFDDWKKVEVEEIRRGKLKGKPREKITDMNEVLALMGIPPKK